MDPATVKKDGLGWFDASPIEGYIPAGQFEETYREWFPDPKVRSRTFFPKGGSADDNGAVVLLAAPLWGLALAAMGSRRRWFRRSADLLLLGGISFLLFGGIRELVGHFDWQGAGLLGCILLLLAARPRGRWSLGDAEATVSTQALVALGIVLLGPVGRYIGWVYNDGESREIALLALRHKYKIGFLCAAAGLTLVAAPLYLPAEAQRRLYDALDFWRSRWRKRRPATGDAAP